MLFLNPINKTHAIKNKHGFSTLYNAKLINIVQKVLNEHLGKLYKFRNKNKLIQNEIQINTKQNGIFK